MTCNTPPSDCFENPGTCTMGDCFYVEKSIGATCNGGQCTADGMCEGTNNNKFNLNFILLT